MRITKLLLMLCLSILFAKCKQTIVNTDTGFTGINPVSYTDVIYKSASDTAFVSTYDGKIYEVINGQNERKQIASVNDEIYSMVYNPSRNEIYAASLNSGLLVINPQDGSVTNALSLNETWSPQICFNANSGLLGAFDVKGKPYLWDSKADFKPIEIPEELDKTRPKYIADNGDVYFDGAGKVSKWNYETGEILVNEIKGQLTDVDGDGHFTLIGGKEFALYASKSDSLIYKKKHPNWPIHDSENDTIVKIPLHLEIISSSIVQDHVYTLGLDKSLRKWDKHSGQLIDTFLKHTGTPSGIATNSSESQLVTVDLLGNIEFWDL